MHGWKIFLLDNVVKWFVRYSTSPCCCLVTLILCSLPGFGLLSHGTNCCHPNKRLLSKIRGTVAVQGAKADAFRRHFRAVFLFMCV